MKIELLATACLLGIVAATPGHSADAPVAADAPNLQLQWDARMRREQMSDDGFARDARADTLRLRLGLLANFGAGWSGLLEGAGVASAGSDYNSGANGRIAYPPITDPYPLR